MTLGVESRDGTGLPLSSVSPRWGDAATGGGAPWQEQVYRRYLPETMGDAWALDARGEYGVRLSGGELLTWFGLLSQSATASASPSAAGSACKIRQRPFLEAAVSLPDLSATRGRQRILLAIFSK